MRQTILDNITERMTAKLTSQRNEVLFFANPHFFFFNFLTAAQVAHFVLPQLHKPTQRQNKKSHFFQRFTILNQTFFNYFRPIKIITDNANVNYLILQLRTT